MNLQYLEYVRGKISQALVGCEGRTKGQLDAFQGAALINTSRYPRKPMREVGGQQRISEPIKCSETRRGKAIRPPIDEMTYCLSSWRRAVSKLDAHQLAWIRYCYAHDLNYDYQVLITQHIWAEFKRTLAGRRITKKVTARLAQLVWLAVQQHASNCGCLQSKGYTVTELAGLTAVNKSTWLECYSHHWQRLLRLVVALDCISLDRISKERYASRSSNLAS